LNNDAWLEPDCLERLLRATEAAGAVASNPLILDYASNEFQSLGALGFDLFGLPTARLPVRTAGPVLMPEGCAYFVRTDVFCEVGGFDPEFFMYSDEYDLSWRIWIAGYDAIRVPEAIAHHRGAAHVNPAGGTSVVENRTSDTKRFYANRNALLVMLKNARGFLLITVLLQLLLYLAEAVASLVLVRRWSYIQRAYLDALADCFRLRRHIVRERRRIALFRKRDDLWMLRFLTWRLNRWEEVRRVARHGLPSVAPK
jgi:GT2 family glycosyltransferase